MIIKRHADTLIWFGIYSQHFLPWSPRSSPAQLLRTLPRNALIIETSKHESLLSGVLDFSERDFAVSEVVLGGLVSATAFEQSNTNLVHGKIVLVLKGDLSGSSLPSFSNLSLSLEGSELHVSFDLAAHPVDAYELGAAGNDTFALVNANNTDAGELNL